MQNPVGGVPGGGGTQPIQDQYTDQQTSKIAVLFSTSGITPDELKQGLFSILGQLSPMSPGEMETIMQEVGQQIALQPSTAQATELFGALNGLTASGISSDSQTMIQAVQGLVDGMSAQLAKGGMSSSDIANTEVELGGLLTSITGTAYEPPANPDAVLQLAKALGFAY
jgi:hypothetical protein